MSVLVSSTDAETSDAIWTRFLILREPQKIVGPASVSQLIGCNTDSLDWPTLIMPLTCNWQEQQNLNLSTIFGEVRMKVVTALACTICLSLPTFVTASELKHETTYASDTAAKATELADRGKCPEAMAIIAMNLRDQRWRSLPDRQKGEILTAWARCATKLANVPPSA